MFLISKLFKCSLADFKYHINHTFVIDMGKIDETQNKQLELFPREELASNMLVSFDMLPLTVLQTYLPVEKLISLYIKDRPKGKRKWEPFRINPIRLFANNKTTNYSTDGKDWSRREVKIRDNITDVVKGCSAVLFDLCHLTCYSMECSLRQHRIFSVPVSQEWKPSIFQKDLRNCSKNYIRIGVNGDPCFDWLKTFKVCEMIAKNNKIPIVLTRLWRSIPKAILMEFANMNLILHVTVNPLDKKPFWEYLLRHLDFYKEIGGKAVLRLITYAFHESSPSWLVQNKLASWHQVLEQPARLMRTHPVWQKVDQERYHPYHSNLNPEKVNKRWWTAGTLYSGKSNVKLCITRCPECLHQCFYRV